MGIQIPVTEAACDGCEEVINLLEPYLAVQLKPQREILVATDTPQTNQDEIPEPKLYLGTKAGRGVMLKFHNFECGENYFSERSSKVPVLESHKEDEIYVPEDNRSPEELVEAGELPPEILAFHAAVNEEDEGGEK